MDVRGGQKRTTALLELVSLVVMSHLMWMLGARLRFSGKQPAQMLTFVTYVIHLKTFEQVHVY